MHNSDRFLNRDNNKAIIIYLNSFEAFFEEEFPKVNRAWFIF